MGLSGNKYLKNLYEDCTDGLILIDLVNKMEPNIIP